MGVAVDAGWAEIDADDVEGFEGDEGGCDEADEGEDAGEFGHGGLMSLVLMKGCLMREVS